MSYQRINLFKLSITLFIVASKFIFTIQQDSCVLPDGITKSTCVRIQRCDNIQNLIKMHNGRPPQGVTENIRAHICPSLNGYVCCPDNAAAKPDIITTKTTTAPLSSATDIPQKPTDLNAIKSHPNYSLLNEKSCGTSVTTRIIGGTSAKLKEFPWAALLGYQLLDVLSWSCGGTLISTQFVLTAAHCFTNELFLVRLGEHTISTEQDCDNVDSCADPVQDIRIEKRMKHPNYKRNIGAKNDIGILKLASPADTKPNNVRTICMPLNPENGIDEIKKKNFFITGWGKTGNENIVTDILQKAYVPFVENSECASIFSPHNIQIYPSYLCAGGHNKTDTCHGDSGGGLSTFSTINSKARGVLYGVVSGGVKCEDPKIIFPGVYINVLYYLDWILDNMN